MIRPSQYGYRTVKTGNRPHRVVTAQQTEDAKAYGLAHGYYGAPGGWIYDASGQHVTHGWGQFWHYIGGQTITRWTRAAGPQHDKEQ